MKYIIVGGGITGLSLTYILAQNGYNVELIEKDKQLGGSWNSQWIDGKYWSENSPRVILSSQYLNLLLNDLNIKSSDLANVYGNFITQLYGILLFIFPYLDINSIIIIIYNYIKYTFYKTDTNETLQEWLDKVNLSTKAKKLIRIFSILLNDIPKKTNVNNFFNTLNIPGAVRQYKNPNILNHKIEEKLKKYKNAKIRKNTTVVKLKQKNKLINEVICLDNNTNEIYNLKCDKVILSCQTLGLLKIVENSDNLIKNNWINYNWLKKWVNDTYYVGVGFQLHFKEKLDNLSFCQTCSGEWIIIIEEVSNWLTEKSKDKNINTVWSCCISDVDKISKHINKSVNQCTKKEIIKECLYQINKKFKIPKPYKITFSEGLYKKDNKWMSKNTGFTRGKYDYLDIKGNIDNLYALGTFTKPITKTIAIQNHGVEASVTYINKYEPKLKGFHNKYVSTSTYLFRILILILVLYYILIYKKMIFKII